MEENERFIIKDDLTYGRGYVYSLQYHIVWCTKYRSFDMVKKYINSQKSK